MKRAIVKTHSRTAKGKGNTTVKMHARKTKKSNFSKPNYSSRNSKETFNSDELLEQGLINGKEATLIEEGKAIWNESLRRVVKTKHYRRSLANQKARKKVMAPLIASGGIGNGVSRDTMRRAILKSKQEIKSKGGKNLTSKVMYMGDRGISNGRLAERDTVRGTLTSKNMGGSSGKKLGKYEANKSNIIGRPKGAKDKKKRVKKVVAGGYATKKRPSKFKESVGNATTKAVGFYNALAN